MSKLICREPQIIKYWKNGWSSEEQWSVQYKRCWGYIDDKFFDQINIFQNLFQNKDKQKKLLEKGIAGEVTSFVVLTEEEKNFLMQVYKEDFDNWHELQASYSGFMNTCCEFIAERPISKRGVRMACYLGEQHIKPMTLGYIWRNFSFRVICVYRNFKLKLYYKKHPFKYYKNYYPGIEKQRKALSQLLSATFYKILNKKEQI